MAEIIDIYDEEMNHIGTMSKDEAHAKGIWHKSFHCWIVKDNYIWFQLRGKNKSNSPDLLGVSAGGHIQAGEADEEGIREVREELGMDVKIEDCVYLLNYKSENYRSEKYNNKEFALIYCLRTNEDLNNLKMQPEEVDGIFEIDINDAIGLFEGKRKQVKGTGVLRTDKKLRPVCQIFNIDDFVVRKNDYYLKTFKAIRKLCNKKGS